MKSKGAILWFLISLSLASALGIQWAQRRKVQATLEAVQEQVEKLSVQERSARSEIQELQREREELRSSAAAPTEAGGRRPTVETVPASPLRDSAAVQAPNTAVKSAGSAEKPSMANLFGNLLKDPEMRKAMAQQQKIGINMLYGSLFKELQLAPDQEQKLRDILLDQQMANMTQASAMMEAGATNRTEMAAQLGEEQKQRNEQVKQLLGDEKYSQYQDYQQTLAERMLLEQFGGELALTPDQKSDLIGIMHEERSNVQINSGSDPSTLTKDPQALLGSAAAMHKVLAQQEQANARVLERAGQVLSPEQVRKLEPVLKTQVEMQRAGAKMARQMFGSDSAGTAPEK